MRRRRWTMADCCLGWVTLIDTHNYPCSRSDPSPRFAPEGRRIYAPLPFPHRRCPNPLSPPHPRKTIEASAPLTPFPLRGRG
jgi:hypothetical protein